MSGAVCVLVTRPEEDALTFAAALREAGHEVVLEPMLAVEPLPRTQAPFDLKGVQALVFTSANGVRVLAGRTSERGLPAYAVGDATACAAREAGFHEVHSAAGDVEALARLVVRRLDPAAGAVFHGAARVLAGDLRGLLEAAGFAVRRAVLYRTVPRKAFSSTTNRALATGAVDVVTFFSPRTAELFVELAKDAGIDGALGHVAAVCLSHAVATKAGAVSWADIRVAARPDQAGLIAAIAAQGS
jgi:uroporphyrinogen-III synthase